MVCQQGKQATSADMMHQTACMGSKQPCTLSPQVLVPSKLQHQGGQHMLILQAPAQAADDVGVASARHLHAHHQT